MTVQIISANLLAALLAGTLIWLAKKVSGENQDRYINYLILVLGGLCGWGVGIISSSVTESDGANLAKLSGIVGAFLSGYLVSKLDKFLDSTLYEAGGVNRTSFIRVALFFSSLLVLALVSFINRTYQHQV